MCTNPLILVQYGNNSETGKPFTKIKHRIDADLNDYYKWYGRENVFLVPCGHCSACILKRRKEWALRCSLEALYHSQSSFITLTYDDDHLVSSLDEVKSDLKKFIKAIRNKGYKVRYFGCGERGSHGTHRLHAHVILFGFLPTDIEYDGKSDSGEAIYLSKEVDDLWKKGRCSVQLCGKNVGQYVAGYTSKKLGQKTGFQIQSTRPGIGYQYLVDHKDEILKYMKIYSKSGIGGIPRYFKKLFEDAYSFVSTYFMDFHSTIAYQQARKDGVLHIEEMNFRDREIYNSILSRLGRSI